MAANFPTVFNVNIGMPPALEEAMTGPFHRDGRPIRLGNLVTRELAAELNPGSNISPETDVANLDRRDDIAAFSDAGFSPPFMKVPVGSRVKFAHSDLQDRGVLAAPDNLALAGLKASKGPEAVVIQPGAEMSLRFSQPGEHSYQDPHDPANHVIILVELGTNMAFMPTVMTSK